MSAKTAQNVLYHKKLRPYSTWGDCCCLTVLSTSMASAPLIDESTPIFSGLCFLWGKHISQVDPQSIPSTKALHPQLRLVHPHYKQFVTNCYMTLDQKLLFHGFTKLLPHQISYCDYSGSFVVGFCGTSQLPMRSHKPTMLCWTHCLVWWLSPKIPTSGFGSLSLTLAPITLHLQLHMTTFNGPHLWNVC